MSLYFKKFGDLNCIDQENVIQIKQKTDFKVCLGLKENGTSKLKLNYSLVSGELFYDPGSAQIEPTHQVRGYLGNLDQVMDLTTTPIVELDGSSVGFKFQIFILTDLEDQFFRIKFTVIDQSQENCQASIWSSRIRVVPRQLKTTKKRKISTIPVSLPESKISKKDLTQIKKDFQKEMVSQNLLLQQVLYNLQDQSQEIAKTRDLATGILMEGGLTGAFRRVLEMLEHGTDGLGGDQEMLRVLNDLKLGHRSELDRLYHLLGRVLKSDSTNDSLTEFFDEIDPKLLHIFG